MSEKLTHTPGPWENASVGIGLSATQVVWFGENTNKGIQVIGTGKDKANARLIAAAPEMLKVLQEILEPCPVKGYLGKYDHRRTYKARKKARAILDRVEGETA